jgi:hypothetical protein
MCAEIFNVCILTNGLRCVDLYILSCVSVCVRRYGLALSIGLLNRRLPKDGARVLSPKRRVLNKKQNDGCLKTQ